MRRLIAYLTLTLTLIFGAALNVFSPLQNVITNNEYSEGREFIYRLSDKDDPDILLTGYSAINEVAEIMDQRMQNFGVSEYNISKEGNNIIRTTTTLQSDEEYNRLQVYLNYNANFTIKIGDDDNTEAQLSASEVFYNVKARVEYRGPYPYIIFPLSNPELFKTTIVDVAETIQSEKGSSETEEGQSRPTLVNEATIVLWTDYDQDMDSYLDPQGDTRGKIFLTFDFRAMWWDEDETEIGVASPLEGATEDQTSYTTSQIKKASDTARYMANVFNAGTLDYDVEFLFSNKFTAPSVEPLVVLGNRVSLSLSSTLFASLVAFILMLLIAFAVYRLPILNALSSGALTFVGTMLIFNAIQVELSTSAIVGLLVVSLVSLASSIIYASKFRNEIYKGRSFKKAHGIAISNSTFLTLDILVVLLISGIFGYFFGGAALTGFATTLIFGSIVMIVSVLIHNALILPLLAFNKVNAKAYSRYGINESKVPNPLKDEKQTYFGRFVEHKPENKAKPHIITLSALSGVTAVLLLAFGAFSSINPFNLIKYSENTTKLYFQVSEDSSITLLASNTNPLTLLSYITLDGESLEVKKVNGEVNVEVNTYTTLEDDIEGQIEVVYNFFVYELVGSYTGDETVSFYTSPGLDAQTGSLLDALDEIVKNHDDAAVVSFNSVVKEATTPHYGRLAWVALVVLAANALYLGLRFGLSRGITTFVETFVASSLVFLFFMASRLPIQPLATMGSFVAIIFVSILNIIIFNSIKEVAKDQASKGLTPKETFDLGHRYSLSLIYILSLVFASSFLVFTLLGPLTIASVYLSGVIAILLSLLVVSKFSAAMLSASLNTFAFKPRAPKVKTTGKQRTSIKSSSSEPEETIILGIND